MAAVAQQPPAAGTTEIPAETPHLLSRQALDAYLLTHAGKHTPLDALPPMARQRFLDSLVFGSKGLGGFDPGDLVTELTRDEIVRVLALFDAQDYAGVVKSRRVRASWTWRLQAAHPGEIERGFDALHHLGDAEKPDALRDAFHALTARFDGNPDAIARLPERELVYLLRSIQLGADHAPTPGDVERLRAVVAALRARNIAQPQDHRMLYDAMLRTRQFEAARQYASRHVDANLPQLPRMEDPYRDDAPAFSAWLASADGGILTRSALDLGPTQLLVTAGCHFSQDAAEDIAGDRVLGPAFAAHARWLMLPPGQEDLAAMRGWNRRFPDAQAHLLYDRSEWALLPPTWRMPEFFIVHEGKVIDHVTGWPRGDAAQRQALIDLLARAGLLDPGKADTAP